MRAWLTLAWANRVKIYTFAKKLQWSRRTWMRVAAVAAVALVVYLAATYGYLDRWDPTTWVPSQWMQLVVNVLGFTLLYLAQRAWWNRQDAVWDEVDELRGQLDELREALWKAQNEPKADTVDAIPSARPFLEAVSDVPTVARTIGGRTFNFKEG